MLFVLTGDIQIGKTRWLQRAIADLEEHGITPYGVLAPGIWIEGKTPDGTPAYEKIGIENELLPGHERIPFAKRTDLARASYTFDPNSQAAKSQLGWAIDDSAIEHVNDHLRSILANTAEDAAASVNANLDEPAARQCDDGFVRVARGRKPEGLLVIDEIGRLELNAKGGLVAAMELVDRGACEALPHALIVVRQQLVERALERFANAPWNGITSIVPSDAAQNELLASYGL